MGGGFMLNRFGCLSLAVLAAGIFLMQSGDVLAQSSLGLGRSEQAIRPEGYFAGLLFWIQQQQQEFYKAMTQALQTIRNDGNAFWYLTGLSFAYGVLHAAGPGHGKAVISSYMLANEVAAKRGIMLSFASAILQGITAIVIMGSIILFLRGTGIKSSNLAGTMEITSYFLVMLLGIYLLWTKLFRKQNGHDHAHTPSPAHVHAHSDSLVLALAHSEHDHSHAHHHKHSHEQGHENGHGEGHHHHDHDHVHTADCGCGHSHAPDPKMLEGDFGLKEAWSAVLAVGLRPCTGAIVVLTFAFLNGLYVTGIVSTFAMSIGTAVTVSAIALIAVSAKNLAVRISGAQDSLGTIHRMIEVAGALLVFLLGFLLFTAAVTV